MGTLDTRGFMDGALRGFDMMDRHYARENSLRQADERMKMDKEKHQAGLRSHDQQMKLAGEEAERKRQEHERLYGTTDENSNHVGGTYWEDRKTSQLYWNLELQDLLP